VGRDTYGLAPLNLLLVVLVSGLLLLPWSELWRLSVVGRRQAKGLGRSSRKQGRTVRSAKWSRGLF
jgi:hypothetical protein